MNILLNILFCGSILFSSFQGALLAKASPNKKQGIGSFHQKQNEWKNFTSKKSGFSVKLPVQPEHVDQTITIPNTDLEITYDTYLSEPNDSSVYVISVWNYPSDIDMSKPEINLQDGFSGMLSALPGSEVLNMSMDEVQGFKALDFLVKNEDIYFQGKLILVHNTLYQVFTVYKSSEDMTNNYINFIDSFKLLEPESRSIAPRQNNNKVKMNV